MLWDIPNRVSPSAGRSLEVGKVPGFGPSQQYLSSANPVRSISRIASVQRQRFRVHLHGALHRWADGWAGRWTKVPQGQWYCEACRAAKRVYGCNACMQNVRPEEILQCDGPKCGLEYHYGCLDPPLTSVPDVKWWYCPACVLTDNRVGCRVCKVDAHYNKLLKCDAEGCDLEWHT